MGHGGSGKTTVMDYLLHNLDDSYRGFKFEAWKYEKDDNLIFSLIEYLVCEAGISGEEIAIEIIKMAGVALKGYAKGLTLQIPGIASYDFSKPFEAIEESAQKEKDKPLSLYETNRKFEEQFLKIEKKILGKKEVEEGKKIIVFIDDLDRCEPENILNLLSALKLFFTYGNNTIFFCGIDKDAVQQAVMTKYSGVMKAEEYLEKVFDVSFSMPLNFDVELMLKKYFPGQINDSITYASFLSKFFTQIEFTTPRHIKKVLNKYEILRSYKNNDSVNQDYNALVPDILMDGSGNHVETLFTLYMIILFEFYHEKFTEIKGFGKKTDLYANLLVNLNEKGGASREARMSAAYDQMENRLGIRGFSLHEFRERYNAKKKIGDTEATDLLINLSLVFTPINISTFEIYNRNYRHHLKQFESKDNTILVNFCYFIGDYQNIIFETDHELTTDYPVYRYFEMAETLL